MSALDLQLPDVKQTVSAPKARSLNFSPDTFGAGMGDVIEGIGRGVNADIRAAVAVQRKEDARKANTAYNRAVAELGALEDWYQQQQLDNADKEFESLAKKRDEIRNKYAAGLSSEQAALFDEDWGNASIRFDGRAQSHRAKQNQALEVANAEGKMLSLALEAARSNGDPAMLAQVNHDFDVTAAKLAADRGIPAGSDADRAFRIEHKGKLHASVVSGMLASDRIGAAQQYLEAYGDEIPPEVRDRVQREVQAVVEAEMPFTVAESYAARIANGEITEADALVELRGSNMKASVKRSAMSVLRGIRNDAEQARRDELERYEIELSGAENPREWVRQNPSKAVALGDAKINKVLRANKLPEDQQIEFFRAMELRAQMQPESYKAMFVDADGNFNVPEEFNDVSPERAQKLVALYTDLKTNGVESKIYKSAAAQVSSQIRADFRKDPVGQDEIAVAMSDWERNYRRENSLPDSADLPYDAVQAAYNTVKQRVATDKGKVLVGRMVRGTVVTDTDVSNVVRQPLVQAAKTRAVTRLQEEHHLSAGEAQGVADVLFDEDNGASTMQAVRAAMTSKAEFEYFLDQTVAQIRAQRERGLGPDADLDIVEAALENARRINDEASRTQNYYGRGGPTSWTPYRPNMRVSYPPQPSRR